MLIKKLAVPLVNEKLLAQAVHCYVVTSGISLHGFEFIRQRIPPACTVDIVTGMEEPVDPTVMRRVLKHYQGRIDLRITLNGRLGANMLMLDLPFRKTVAFVGSGSLTLGGLKDNDEIFWKVVDPKEIEGLKSWFVGYFEFAEQITESLTNEYELVYHRIRQNEIQARKLKTEALKLTTRGFSWDTIKFKTQYFKKEDYLLLGIQNADKINPVIVSNREQLVQKLQALGQQVNRETAILKIHTISHADIMNPDPLNRRLKNIDELGLAFGRSDSSLKKYPAGAMQDDFLQFQISLRPRELRVALKASAGMGKFDRENIRVRLEDAKFTTNLFKTLSSSNAFIEVAGEHLPLSSFKAEDSLTTFLQQDNWQFYDFCIGRDFQPGDPAISEGSIADTITSEFKKLAIIYELVSYQFQ